MDHEQPSTRTEGLAPAPVEEHDPGLQVGYALLQWRTARQQLLVAESEGWTGRALAVAQRRQQVTWANYWECSRSKIGAMVWKAMRRYARHHLQNGAASEQIIQTIDDSVEHSVVRLTTSSPRAALSWLRTISERRTVDWRREEERRQATEEATGRNKPTGLPGAPSVDQREWWQEMWPGVRVAARLYRELLRQGRDGPHWHQLQSLGTSTSVSGFDMHLKVVEWRHREGLSCEQIYAQPGFRPAPARTVDSPVRRQRALDKQAQRGRYAIWLGSWVGLGRPLSANQERLLRPIYDHNKLRPKGWTLEPGQPHAASVASDGDDT